MAKYKITVIVESDDDYNDGDQIEDLRSDMQMLIADYNCFIVRQDVQFEELNPPQVDIL